MFARQPRAPRQRRQLRFENLETRKLMANCDPSVDPLGCMDDGAVDIPSIEDVVGAGGDESPIPALSSNPGAPATLYLDFDGHLQEDFTEQVQYFNQPAFDFDGDETTFSSDELATMHYIWAAVAEDYAPFNINVTTVDPGSFEDGEAVRVAIGGDGLPWYSSIAGVALFNSFTNPDYVNTAFVFSESILAGGSAAAVAKTVSHEAGHSFGLYHQSRYEVPGDGTSELLEEYHTGDAKRGPIMGHGQNSERALWWRGDATHKTNYGVEYEGIQDDMAVLAGQFGYRPDDHGSSFDAATPVEAFHIDASGIVERMSDRDYFAFSVAEAGEFSVELNVAEIAPNLDARLELLKLAETLPGQKESLVVLQASDPNDELGARITVNLEPGVYFLSVRSHGGYGDVGQYTLLGGMSLGPTPPDFEPIQEPPLLDDPDRFEDIFNQPSVREPEPMTRTPTPTKATMTSRRLIDEFYMSRDSMSKTSPLSEPLEESIERVSNDRMLRSTGRLR